MSEKILKEINITDIEGVRIGNAQDKEAMTGTTVILLGKENRGGVHISGGGPASREAHLLAPLTNPHTIHALVLSGGSAFGLAASTGVMEYLKDRGIGYRVAGAVVPLVVQSCIFDRTIGFKDRYPDLSMGYEACLDAERDGSAKSGIIGAGTGAAIGKVRGIFQAQKSGMGYAAYQLGDLKVGAVACVNAYGDVFDGRDGTKIGGILNKERRGFLDAEEELFKLQLEKWSAQKTADEAAGQASEPVAETGANTTLCAVITNASFNQPDMSKVASMAQAGMSRCIRPVGTMADGDTTYAFSMGDVEADINVVGTLAAKCVEDAIFDAVMTSRAQMNNEAFARLINLPKPE